MIRLVTADVPDIVALQELPLWALTHLERWSGMKARVVRAMPALLGPLGGLAARLDPLRFRSMATGQGNAILANPHFEVGAHRMLVLNPDLAWQDRLLRWEHRRICHSLELASPDGSLVVANLHAAPDREQAKRAAAFVGEAERCILCGDFNVRRLGVPGFTTPIAGLDQILVRGLEFAKRPAPWPDARRQVDGVLLSDHAPVEAVIA
jgi:endonuclease/exonuclease/phosphatase family metal-dependent hydrolase